MSSEFYYLILFEFTLFPCTSYLHEFFGSLREKCLSFLNLRVFRRQQKFAGNILVCTLWNWQSDDDKSDDFLGKKSSNNNTRVQARKKCLSCLIISCCFGPKKHWAKRREWSEMKKSISRKNCQIINMWAVAHIRESKLMGDHALNMYVNIMLLLAIMWLY